MTSFFRCVIYCVSLDPNVDVSLYVLVMTEREVERTLIRQPYSNELMILLPLEKQPRIEEDTELIEDQEDVHAVAAYYAGKALTQTRQLAIMTRTILRLLLHCRSIESTDLCLNTRCEQLRAAMMKTAATCMTG